MITLDDKQFEREKRRVKRAFRRLRPRLWAGWWAWDIVYDRYPDDHHNETGKEVNASITADWRYRQAVITFYMPAIAEMGDEELDMVIIHEVLHAWVNPMRPRAPKPHEVDLEENVVTNLTSVHVCTYLLGIKEGRRLERKERAGKKKSTRTTARHSKLRR
ncbi:hypothetical protein LCGC14_1935570 [marine sediment metagenome]|uniref:SprT-like domain-containing protein n=1 Tax=marine sediment metagenome TaxID=412755 RepID=A0A0F9FLV1_9ZZZZ